MIKKLQERKYCRRTISGIASVYRNFITYGEIHGWCKKGLSHTIEAPRIYYSDSLPLAPDWKNVQLILQNKKTDHPTDIRNYAILLLLSIYGLRRSEEGTIRLYSMTGNKIKEEKITVGNNQFIASGSTSYFLLQIQIGDQKKTYYLRVTQ